MNGQEKKTRILVTTVGTRELVETVRIFLF